MGWVNIHPSRQLRRGTLHPRHAKGAFLYAKPDLSQISGNTRLDKRGTAFCDETGPTNRNGPHIFIPFSNSLIRKKNQFAKNGTANFGWNIPTEISGPPNITVRRNRNGPLHLNSEANFGIFDIMESTLGYTYSWNNKGPRAQIRSLSAGK